MSNIEERNCAFQYAKVTRIVFSNTDIVHDESNLTLNECIALWNKYYPDCAKFITDEYNTAEMVIWINMEDPTSYKDTLHYISTDAESDGTNIWETTKKYFPKTITN